MGKSKRNELVPSEAEITFSGPLPAPIHLDQYEKTLPGAAERILKMAEEQSEHRRALEAKITDAEIRDTRKGLWFGFLVSLSGFGIVAYCTFLGEPVLAGIIAALDLGSLVGVFVYGSQQKKSEED